jgi:hypothetical protein
MDVPHLASVTACDPRVQIVSAFLSMFEATTKNSGQIGSTLLGALLIIVGTFGASAMISHRARSNLRNLCRFLIDSAPKQLPMLPRLWRNSKRPRRGKGKGQSEDTWSRYRAMGVQIDSTQWVLVKKAKPKKRSPRSR